MKQVTEVFGISNEVLTDSYVDRGALDAEIFKHLARRTHIALRGESKCGKSWLRQKTISNPIVVQCRLDKGVHDIYVDALSQLGVKLTLEDVDSGKIKGRVEATVGAGKGLLSKLISLEASAGAAVEGEARSTVSSTPVGHDVSDLRFVAEILKESGKRLIIEDFHYLSMAERKRLAFDLKALWDYGLFVVIIGVWNQANMLTYLNPDLSGRMEEIPIYWSSEDLAQVIEKGGDALNLKFSEAFKEACVSDCYGNVGILQALTLKALDEMRITCAQKNEVSVDDLELLNAAAMLYAEQLNALYQQFAKRVSSGIRTRKDSTGIYAHAMAVVLEAPDDMAIKGIDIEYIYQKANERESRIQKVNLHTILEKIEQLQVDEEGRGLVVAYNEADRIVSVVDRQLLLYRKYATVKWPWEDLIAESKEIPD